MKGRGGQREKKGSGTGGGKVWLARLFGYRAITQSMGQIHGCNR